MVRLINLNTYQLSKNWELQMFQSKKLITAHFLRAPKYYVNTSSYVVCGPLHQPNPSMLFQ